jgi:hypothetical protein
MTAHPSESSFLQLWTVIQQSTDDLWLAVSIIALAPFVPEAYYPQVFQTALALPATHPHVSDSPEWRLGNVLEALAKNVPESFFMQFWNMVSTMDEKWQHIRRISLQQKLLMRVPDSCFATIWNAISQVETTQNQREQLYDLLITLTPERHFGQVWETVEALENQVRQGQWLLILAPKVPENFFAPFWEIVKTVKNGYLRAQILKALIPQLPRTMLDEAVEMALTIPLYEARMGALEKLIHLLSTEQCEAFLATLLPAHWENEVELSEVFASLQNTWQPGHWERIMLALAPQLSEERLQAILPALLQVILKHLRSDEDRVDTLKKLLGRVPESALPATMEAIWSIQMEHGQEDVLATLLTSSSDKPRTWIRVLELATEKTRATGEIRYLLHTLQAAPVALQQTAPQQLYPVLHDILHTLAQFSRREALTDLVSLEPTLRALGGEEALISTVCAALEIGCWWP